MGLRSKRFAAIVENGVFTSLQIDEKGYQNSSAENILTLL
jgi:peroxiredoxin